MTSTDVTVMNEATKLLIDSVKGHENAARIAEENPALSAKFRSRAQRRRELVGEFQLFVEGAGGEPAQDDEAAGAAHRAFADFASMLSSDEEAALDAVDDSEERPAEDLEAKLKKVVSAEARALLGRARRHVLEGEAFANRLD